MTVTTNQGWYDRLAEYLIGGLSPSDAATKCADSEVSQDAALAIASRFAAHPLLRAARVEAIRREARDWWLDAVAELRSLDPATRELASRPALDRDEFVSRFYLRNEPVLLPGVASLWPAVSSWGKDYLIDRLGHITVEVMRGRASAVVSDQNTSEALRHEVLFADYVRLVYDGGPSNDHYLVSRNHFFADAATRPLLDDLIDLPYVRTRSGGDSVRLWFGPSGTITPLHYDAMNNVVIQIVGRKNVRLYPPHVSAHMRQTRPWYASSDPAEAPDPAVSPLSLSLGPGDALFIPVGWWHALVALEVSVTLACIDFGLPNYYGVS